MKKFAALTFAMCIAVVATPAGTQFNKSVDVDGTVHVSDVAIPPSKFLWVANS